MPEWYCFRDRVPMEKTRLRLRYLEITHTTQGLKCPKCGASYLDEETSLQIREGEQILENK